MRFGIRLFRYSVFTLVGLVGLSGLWIVTNQDLSALVKYEGANQGINTVLIKTFGGAGKNTKSKTNVLNVRDNQEKIWMNVVKNPKTDSGLFGSRDFGRKNQNAKSDKPISLWKVATKRSQLNRDTTRIKLPSSNTSKVRRKKTSVNPSRQADTRNAQPSKQSFTFPSRASELYGEAGCADNPWRKGLSELLQAWTNISKQHNIEYVLACGSLLGAMRNRDVIPYDSDIDILIDVNYWPIMKRLSVKRNFTSSDENIYLVLQPEFTLNIPVESRKRYDCQGKETPHLVDECSFQEPMGRLIKGNHHIDFFHFYERVHKIDDPSNSKVKEYDKKDFYPFTPCNFMGLKASCPNRPWKILQIYFDTENFEPIYKCKNGTWVDEHGEASDVF